jgi:hypothetical protein
VILVDEVHSGRGFQGHFGSRLHFGLLHREAVERIEVRWPGGAVEAFGVDGVDRMVTLTEGAGMPFVPSEPVERPSREPHR